MNRRPHSPTLSPSERAHLKVLQQEARRRRLERLIEEEAGARSLIVECMEGESYHAPSCLHHHGTQWEVTELCRVNEHRSASRICFQLPEDAYKQSRCGKYASCDRG
jgi:hypothetical protein